MIRIDETRRLFLTEFGSNIEEDLGLIKDGSVKGDSFCIGLSSFSLINYPEISDAWMVEWPGGKPEEEPEAPLPTEVDILKQKIVEQQQLLADQKDINAVNTQTISDMMDAVFTMLAELIPIPPTE